MKAFFDPGQTAHDPQTFLANGVLRPSPEQPRRAEVLHEAAVAAGCEFSVPEDHGIAFISDVHPSEYLAFLQNIHARWQRMDGASEEVVPNVHPNRHGVSYPDGMVGQAGWHMADTACPIGPHTWASAYLSAQSAVSGAQAVLSGEQAVYALCRPPGHHAFSDMAGAEHEVVMEVEVLEGGEAGDAREEAGDADIEQAGKAPLDVEPQAHNCVDATHRHQ